MQRIHHRISGYKNFIGRHAFTQQQFPVSRGGCEVICREATNKPAVHFLGEGIAGITRTKPSFHVGHGGLMVKAGKCPGQSCGCVSLDNDHIRRFLAHDWPKTCQHTSADFIRCLLTLHNL